MSSIPTNADPATDAAPVPATPVSTRPPVLRTLIRREFWEHRALWMAPLATAALLLVAAIFGQHNYDSAFTALPEQRLALFGVVMAYASVAQFVVLGLIVWMYASDCLYTERKDRSILFWKSMPVSDTLTVLSKVLVVTVIVPLGVYLVSALTTLLMSAIYLVRAWQDHAGGGAFWDASAWLRIQWVTLLTVVAGVLWYAPVTAFLMLVSAWARRSVQLWVFLTPAILVILERMVLGSHHVWNVLKYRLGNVFMDLSWTDAAHSSIRGLSDNVDKPMTLNLMVASVDPMPVLTNVDLWLGLVVAALLIVATVRIRQYRDDT
jgi:ABC-2 type transport system permease protein